MKELNEQKFKAALNENIPEWDESGVWDQIEETLPQKKSRRMFIIWFLSGISFLIIGMLLVINLSNYDHSKMHLDSAVEVDTKFQSDTKINEQNRVKRLEVNSNVSKHTPNTDLLSANTVKTIALASQNEIINEDKNLGQQSSSKYSLSALSHADVDNQFRKFEALNLVSASALTQEKFLIEMPLSRSSRNIDHLEMIKALPIDYLQIPNVSNLNLSMVFVSVPLTKVVPDDHLKDAVLMEGGIYMTKRNIQSQLAEWLTAKNNLEKPLETLDFSLIYKKAIRQNLHLGLGLGYAQTNESLIWRDTVASAIDTSYTSNIQSVVKTYEVTKLTTPNAYQTLYVPLSVGYGLSNGKMLYEFKIGGDIAIKNSFRGRYLSTELTLLSSDANDDIPVNNRIGLQSVNATFNINYQLNEKLYLSAGMRTRVDLKNRITEASSSLKYKTYGLVLGVKYSL